MVVGIVADATDVSELRDASVDGVIASQLIEHVDDDGALVRELARILKPNGWWYVSSVLRARHAWWIYRVQGSWRLDPTHVREYRSEGELLEVLSHPDLTVTSVATAPVSYSLLDLALRGAARVRLTAQERLPAIYRERPLLRKLRAVRARVPGYRIIEAAGRRARSP